MLGSDEHEKLRLASAFVAQDSHDEGKRYVLNTQKTLTMYIGVIIPVIR